MKGGIGGGGGVSDILVKESKSKSKNIFGGGVGRWAGGGSEFFDKDDFLKGEG